MVAGFGDRAQWLRNVRADPRVRVSTGTVRSVPAAAHELAHDQADTWLARYTQEHPFAWQVLAATMEQGLGTDIAHLPVVVLQIAPEPDATRGRSRQ